MMGLFRWFAKRSRISTRTELPFLDIELELVEIKDDSGQVFYQLCDCDYVYVSIISSNVHHVDILDREYAYYHTR